MGIEKVNCEKCKQVATVSRLITRDGSTHMVTFCFTCNDFVWANSRYAYSKSLFTPEEIEAAPIAVNYQDAHNLKCEYQGCNRSDVQWHHFGLQSVVPDPNEWPGAWLCQAHHDTWHALITPNMTMGGIYMRVCPNCGQQINSMTIVSQFGDPPDWMFWGTPGHRWKVCDYPKKGFVHFRVKLDIGKPQHRLALIKGTEWVDTMKVGNMASPSMNGSQRG